MVGRKRFPGPPCLSWNQSDMSSVGRSPADALAPGAMATSRPWQYERIGNGGSEASCSSAVPIGIKKGWKRGWKPSNLKLGFGDGSSSGYHSSRIARLNRLMKVPSAMVGRVKEQCAAWRSHCCCGDLRVSDLFAGNQLFLHVHPAPVRCHKKQHDLKPSLGFLAGFQGARTACETHVRVR